LLFRRRERKQKKIRNSKKSKWWENGERGKFFCASNLKEKADYSKEGDGEGRTITSPTRY